jgi:hypothetical protein
MPSAMQDLRSVGDGIRQRVHFLVEHLRHRANLRVVDLA